MTPDQLAARVAELDALRKSEPETLIALYRRRFGLGLVDPLPRDLTLPEMILAIANDEAGKPS